MTVLEKQIIERLSLETPANNAVFRDKLKQNFPKLTAYDLRLCTYLKANLSTKEIAIVLNITPDSAKKAKHRLRKKLEMSPRESYYFFFDRI